MSKERFTQILLFLVAAFGGVLGTQILNKQEKMIEDIAAIKVAIGIIQNEQNNLKENSNDFKERLKNYKITKFYKHEDFITFKKINNEKKRA